MQNWKHVAHETKDLLTVCLAKAIDTALTAQMGHGWFTIFAEADSKEKMNLRITKPGQQTVQDMDLQALLKFLRFRTAHTDVVLSYHGFFNGMDAIAIDAQKHQLTQLLDRLMVDFRNRIEAHSRAADIEQEISGNGLNRIYGYEEAVQDMLRLARLFPTVKDAKGVPYCRRIESLAKPKRNLRWLPIVATLTAAAVAAGGVTWWLNNKGDNGDATPDVQTETSNIFYDDSDPVYTPDKVTVQPIQVYYEGDELILVCYINNGTDATIPELDVTCLTLYRDGRVLAEAPFGVVKDYQNKPLAIPAQSNVTVRFTFKANTVHEQNADLHNVTADVEYPIQQ